MGQDGPTVRRELHEENRVAWNAATDAHNSHKLDQAGFLRSGGTTLHPEEVELLGELRGLSILHLQCNAGQDTLSIAKLGATVTGVDISDSAIEFARRLSTDSGIPAAFHRADVFDWLAEAADADERYDVVFSSYGAIIWLSDLASWARGVAAVLKPGGRFVLVEFHPFVMVFDEEWRPKYPYSSGGIASSWEEGIGDYVAMAGEGLTPSGFMEGVKDFRNPHRSHEFNWGLAEILTALLDAGLALDAFREWPYSNGARLFERMREEPGRRMYPPEDMPSLPMMYGLVASKPLAPEATE